MQFSTKDRDNDWWGGRNCAISRVGAWWYKSCDASNLNGLYRSGLVGEQGVVWNSFLNNWVSLKFAGHALDVHNGLQFTTKDRDNDLRSGGNCAIVHRGAWWYEKCHHSNLNGLYLSGQVDHNGVNWVHFGGRYSSLKFAQMKLRFRD